MRVVGDDEVHMDYDKEYRFSGTGGPPNRGKVRASLRLRQNRAGSWMITADFDRKICWSSQMRDPLMQSPPGGCQ
ncbi:MAG: hypothetical protein JWN34_590 [Bryobacterales bacterium]|nr:hypothetical protein [Bryobacterales bacterium]